MSLRLAFTVALTATAIGSGIVAYASVGLHEALHCWADRLRGYNRDTQYEIHIEPTWSPFPRGVSHSQTGLAVWEHPLIWTAQAGLWAAVFYPLIAAARAKAVTP